jgi:hypothetical protein
MIKTIINTGMLQGQNVLWLFHDTNPARVTLVTATYKAGVRIGNIIANGAQYGLLPYRCYGFS